MTNHELHRAASWLTSFGRLYPKAWRQIRDFRAERGRSLPDWPSWCFCPLDGAYAAVGDGGDVPPAKARHIGIVGALAAWRTKKIIATFDPDLMRALAETPITGELPIEVLLTLPAAGMYIALPPTPGLVGTLHGFFVHLDYNVSAQRSDLRLVFDETLPDDTDDLICFPVHLDGGTLLDALERTEQSTKQHAQEHDLPWIDGGMRNSSPVIQRCIAPTLYLLSDDPDITVIAPPATAKKPARRGRTPDAPTQWTVGSSMGEQLRAYEHDTSPKRPRPHIRRAHWHLYWTGPQRKKPALRWLAPMMVAAR